MKKLIAPALLALIAMASTTFAQSAIESQPGSTTRERSSAADSEAGSNRSTAAGQPSTRDGAVQGTRVQQRSTTQSSASPAEGNQANNRGDMLSQHIAVCLALGNQEEAALGKFAQDRAQHPEVKQFAQMLVQEHQQAVQKIQQAVPQVASLNLQLSAQGDASNRGAGSATTSTASAQSSGEQRNSASGVNAGDQTQQMVQLAQEIKQECYNLTTAELGQKQGADFDKAFIGQQLVAHTQMLAHLKTYQKHASSQLQPIIQEGTQMTEHHIAQARQIMQQLSASDSAGGEAAQNPQSGARPTQPRS
jgi:predicted outer membrane protein